MANTKKRSLKRGLSAVVLGTVAVLVVVGWHYHATAQQPGAGGAKAAAPAASKATAPKAAKTQIHTIARGDVLKRLFITGELKAERSIDILAPQMRMGFSATVTYLAPEGAQIKQGERIVEFDDSALQSQKSEIERRLDETALAIEKTKADLEAQRCDLLNSVTQAEADLKVAELYGKIGKDLLPANTYQKYQLDLEKAKLALQKAKEQLANFEASYQSQMALVQINRAQAEIDAKRLDGDLALLKKDAPQDGILIYGDNWASNRKIQPGDNVFPGMQVVQLPDLSTMQVIGYVYDTEYSFLSRGMRCSFSLDSSPGAEFQGSIISLTSVAGRKGFASQKKVFKAVIKPDKVDLTVMKPGMTARIEIPLVLAKDVTTVAREYLGVDPRGGFYVIKGSDPKTASRQAVQVGEIGDRVAQVLSGVSVGDPLLPVQAGVEGGK
jgi:multidrug efflux pump subunit AcrA (membrane-fusion protein)